MSEAPERMWIDPDILPPEWHKRYHCDVEYVRADRIEELEAKLAFAIGVFKDMRDDRVCYRHEAHFRRRAAVVVKELTGGKDE